jgi:hypothetical protein
MSEGDILRRLTFTTAQDVLQNKPNSPLGELLGELTQDIIEQLKERLQARNINASEGLSQSIGTKGAEIEGDSISVAITMDFYWKYIQYGVNGTEVSRGAPQWGKAPAGEKSFHQAIKDWIPSRGLSLPEQFKDYDSFAWAIMVNKRKKGQEAKPFFTDVINEQLVSVLKKPIEQMIGRAIEINIVEPWQ